MKFSPTHLFHAAFQNYSEPCLKGPLEYRNSLYQSINRSLLLASDVPSAVFGHPRTKAVFHGGAAYSGQLQPLPQDPPWQQLWLAQSRREHLSHYAGVACLRACLPNEMGSSPRVRPALSGFPEASCPWHTVCFEYILN